MSIARPRRFNKRSSTHCTYVHTQSVETHELDAEVHGKPGLASESPHNIPVELEHDVYVSPCRQQSVIVWGLGRGYF